MPEAPYPKNWWEENCKTRIRSWHVQLLELAEGKDPEALKMLKCAIEAQVALADLKIKARQADWAKLLLWLPRSFP
jgi:hypothetical protein